MCAQLNNVILMILLTCTIVCIITYYFELYEAHVEIRMKICTIKYFLEYYKRANMQMKFLLIFIYSFFTTLLIFISLYKKNTLLYNT